MDQGVVTAVFEHVRVGEVADPHRTAANLVFICGTDTAPGRADLLLAAPLLASTVERAMRRQDQRGIVGKLQVVRRDFEPLAAQYLRLGEERPRVAGAAA